MRALQQLKPGMMVAAEVGADGTPQYLNFLSGRDTLVRIGGPAEGYRATEERAQLEARTVMKSSVIRSSLFAASDAAGIPDSIAMQLADVFGGDIDFHRDLRKGDRFAVVYELHHFAGRPVRAGRVLAAEFTNQGKTFRAVHFNGGYYAPDGKNLRKAFLRSPLEFSRVSSGFGTRAPSDPQGLARAQGHRLRGADRHARARVGNGFVDFAGPKGGYGNVVIVRHHGQYATVYAHLSRIAVHSAARASSRTTRSASSARPAGPPARTCTTSSASPARRATRSRSPCRRPLRSRRSDLPAFRAHAAPLAAQLDLLANGNLAQLE